MLQSKQQIDQILYKCILYSLNETEFIQKTCEKFVIFRLSNVVGNTKNPHTIFNFFIQQIRSQQHFEVWENANRNLIDVDDVFKICNIILLEKKILNQIINIANPTSTSVLEIINEIETHFQLKGNYTRTLKGMPFNINIEKICSYILYANINFDGNYISLLLKKYFPNDL
ncbi:MAG: NAD(P)-dependent oxidoreductase [Chitinophagaceae bacterium]|nr:NAD(P)-dependent oxidoreductase [Chitinophagaceae bacterium]